MTLPASPGAAVPGCQPPAWSASARLTNTDMAHRGIRWNNLLPPKRPGKISCGSGGPSTTANRSGPAGDTGPQSTRTHVVWQARAPAPSTWGAERVVALAGGPLTYALKQNKDTQNEPRTKKETPRPRMCPAQLPDATVQCSSNLHAQLPFPARINIVIKVTVVISPPPLLLPTCLIRRVCRL